MTKRPRTGTDPAAILCSPPHDVMVASLPTTCISNILRFVVGDGAPSSALYPEPFPLTRWHRSLVSFQFVSREWRAAAALLVARATQHVARIDVTAAVVHSQSSLPASSAVSFASIDRHPSATDLRLVMRSVLTVGDTRHNPLTAAWVRIPSDYDDAVQLLRSNRVVRSMGSIAIDWPAVLASRTASLVRLDLSQVPLDCVHLGSVLHAASTSCAHVRVLALPGETAARYSEDNEAREANLNELYGALQRWHRTNGGLLHLRIPFGRFDENTAVRLLRSLAAYCPAIEYLDGWQDTYHLDADGMASCEVYWPAPWNWWEQFWRKCTKLRTFNTVVMPFDDAYIHHSHPSVETLILAIDSAKARHYEVSHQALAMLPMRMANLQRLILQIPFVRDDVWSPRESIDDGFVRTVVAHAPQLREFRLQCADTRVLFEITSASTDRLATLKDLEVVELQRVREFTYDMFAELFRPDINMRLAISFATGQNIVWYLLQSLARRRFRDGDTTKFSLSLWFIGAGFGHGVQFQKDQVETLVERLKKGNGTDVEAHVCTTQRVHSEQGVVDIAHVEYRLHDRLARPGSTCDGASEKTRGFRFPVCEEAERN